LRHAAEVDDAGLRSEVIEELRRLRAGAMDNIDQSQRPKLEWAHGSLPSYEDIIHRGPDIWKRVASRTWIVAGILAPMPVEVKYT